MNNHEHLMEKLINVQPIFKGRIIDVHLDTIELPNGKQSTREVVDHPGGICIAALTNKNELIFVKQYRHPYLNVILELPAGKLEPGENPLETGKRELKEETGAIGVDYMSLGKVYPTPGYCGEIIYLYFCKVHHFEETKLDEDEFVDVVKIDINKAVDMILNNEISDAKTQIAVLKIAKLIEKNLL